MTAQGYDDATAAAVMAECQARRAMEGCNMALDALNHLPVLYDSRGRLVGLHTDNLHAVKSDLRIALADAREKLAELRRGGA